MHAKLTSTFTALAILAAATLAAPNDTSTSSASAASSSAPATSAPTTSSAASTPSVPATPPVSSSSTPTTTPAPPASSAPATTSASSPPAAPSAPAGGNGTCTTGSLQCCQSILSANSTALAPILSLLGVVLQDLDVPVGLSCSGITGVGVGGSDACSANAVCCENNDLGGIIAIGCLPATL